MLDRFNFVSWNVLSHLQVQYGADVITQLLKTHSILFHGVKKQIIDKSVTFHKIVNYVVE